MPTAEVRMSVLCVSCVTTDVSLRDRLQLYIEAEGNRFEVSGSTAEFASAHEKESTADLVLVDAPRHSWRNSLSLSKIINQFGRDRVAVITDPGDSACQQFVAEQGVSDILTKPVLSQDLHRWMGAKEPLRTGGVCKPVAGPADCIVEELPNGRFFLAACPAMHDLYRTMRLLAPVDVPVLILGESGVGKEIVSHLLHKHSLRAQREMTDVNCAALPSELLESELFGYEAGAFTGAQKPKPGKFELAHRSTLLLDEIGEMSPGMQAKLLHVLQDGHFSRLGARVSSQVDVRVLAATNVNLEEAIAKHRFREDLYYRLNAFSVRVPALRERREEIPHLIREMLKRSAVTLNREPLEVSPQLVELAQEYSWPGNLRELRNFITRLLVLRDEKTAASDLAAKLRGRSSSAPATPADVPPVPAPNMRAVVRGVKDQAEMRLIGDALRATSWNRRRAAANLQISYRALLYKIQQYGLAQDSGRELVGHSQMSVTAIDQGSRPLSSALTA
jgi:two-component system response regulator AtoC